MDIFSFWKCIESSIQDIAELAPYLPVRKVSEQKQNIFKIKMFSLFTELKLEEVKKNKKFCIAHFHSRIFIRWLEIIQDQLWFHLVCLEEIFEILSSVILRWLATCWWQEWKLTN